MRSVGLLSFLSCEDSIEREPSPIVPPNCQNVFFPNSNTTDIELEPTELAQVIVPISREDSKTTATVPIKVFSADDVFNIPETVTFDAGEDTTSFVVTFPEAEEGIKYSFEIGISGDEYFNPYINNKTSIKFPYCIKWENIGKGVMIEDYSNLFGVPLYPFMWIFKKQLYLVELLVTVWLTHLNRWSQEDFDEYGIADGYPYNALKICWREIFI